MSVSRPGLLRTASGHPGISIFQLVSSSRPGGVCLPLRCFPPLRYNGNWQKGIKRSVREQVRTLCNAGERRNGGERLLTSSSFVRQRGEVICEGKTPSSFIKALNGVSVGALSQLLVFNVSFNYETRLAEVETERKSPKSKFNR